MHKLVIILGASVAAKIGSLWIDSLYEKNLQILSYPQRLGEKITLRQIFLFVGIIVGFFFLELKGNFFVAAVKILPIYFLLLITCTDFEQEVIFDKVLIPLAICAVIFWKVFSLPVLSHILAAAVGGGIFFLISVMSGGGIGGGDVKLIFVLGLLLGVKNLLDVVLIGCVAGGVVALILILTGLKNRKDFFAYGPYFAGAAIFKIVFS